MVTGIEQGLDLLPPKVQDQALSEDLSSLRDFDPVFSVSGFEYSKLFARERGFRLSTAARMASTFPLITPAVYLPTRPAVRVVDSGFRDNYGVELAADWIFQNREWLKANTSGVALIQIRCLGDPEDRSAPGRHLGRLAGAGLPVPRERPPGRRQHLLHRGGHPQRPRAGPARPLLNEPAEDGDRALLHDRRLRTPQLRPADPGRGRLARGPGRLVLEEMGSLARRPLLVADRFRGPGDPSGRPAPGLSGLGRSNAPTRRGRLCELREALNRADPERRSALLWEYERARNYERLETLRRWWMRPGETGERD